MLFRLILLGFAGACGTLARYGLGKLLQHPIWAGFPVATLVTNILGCFLFGLIMSASEGQSVVSQEAKLLIFIGFLGSFTTFSTFTMDTVSLFREGNYALTFLNIFLSNGVGIAFALIGLSAGKLLR